MKKYQDIVLDSSGNAVLSATVTVSDNIGGGVSTIYADNAGTVLANPLTASSVDGAYYFYAPDGRYDIAIAATGFTIESLTDIYISDGSFTVDDKAGAQELKLSSNDSGRKVFITSDDGGEFTIKYNATPSTYADDGGSFCGSQFIPTGGDGTIGFVRDANDDVNDLWFGAKNDRSTDDTTSVLNAVTAAGINPVRVGKATQQDNDLKGVALTVDLKDILTKASKQQLSCLPRLMRKLEEYNEDTAPTINIVGMGSSVGNGSTLPSPSTQSPINIFGDRLEEKFNKLGYINITTTNRSVDGSTITESIAKLAAIIAEPIVPDVLVLAYGMNDGATAIFNSGQTYPAVYTRLVELINDARDVDCDVVIMTTPHPHTTRFNFSMSAGIAQAYPTAVAADVPDESLIPPVSTSTPSVDVLGYGSGHEIPISHRHFRVNQSMRRVGVDMGVPVIDVEHYWFEAVYRHGQDNLFDAGQSNHPNLTGHRQSYWIGINEFVDALAESHQQGTQQNSTFRTRIGINEDSPSSVLDVKQDDSADVLAQFKDDTGTALVDIDASGQINQTAQDLTNTLSGILITKSNWSTNERKTRHFTNVGTAQNIATVTNSGGRIIIWGYQTGIGRETHVINFQNAAGTVALGTPETIGAAVNTVTASGANIVVTPVAANTNIAYSLEHVRHV